MSEVDLLRAGMGFLLGLLIGSFLNVCIYRWPRDLSVVRPRSHCPGCDAQIAWYDNIPVLSYLLLRARCRNCAAPISYRYPLVELLTAGFFSWLCWRLGFSLGAAKYCALVGMLIALMFMDLEERILADEFTLGGMLLGFAFSPLVRIPDITAHAVINGLLGIHFPERGMSVAESLFGALIPAGSLWLGGWLFKKFRHKEGLGLGDVKMMAMVGAFLGVRGALLTLIVGSLAGSVIGLIYIRVTKQDMSEYELPFGTFLAGAAILAAIFGPKVISWYSALL
jgi:leader peptidase (prepilin peptidase)/N-methyltransferase